MQNFALSRIGSNKIFLLPSACTSYFSFASSMFHTRSFFFYHFSRRTEVSYFLSHPRKPNYHFSIPLDDFIVLFYSHLPSLLFFLFAFSLTCTSMAPLVRMQNNLKAPRVKSILHRARIAPISAWPTLFSIFYFYLYSHIYSCITSMILWMPFVWHYSIFCFFVSFLFFLFFSLDYYLSALVEYVKKSWIEFGQIGRTSY